MNEFLQRLLYVLIAVFFFLGFSQVVAWTQGLPPIWGLLVTLGGGFILVVVSFVFITIANSLSVDDESAAFENTVVGEAVIQSLLPAVGRCFIQVARNWTCAGYQQIDVHNLTCSELRDFILWTISKDGSFDLHLYVTPKYTYRAAATLVMIQKIDIINGEMFFRESRKVAS